VKKKALWELYSPESGASVTELYIFKIKPFEKRRDALACRDYWAHKYGYNLEVRQVKR
jgi:hypothetical protein